MDKDKAIQKLKAGELRIKDITDSSVRAAAEEFLQKEHPELDFKGDFSDKLLKDKDVLASIEA